MRTPNWVFLFVAFSISLHGCGKSSRRSEKSLMGLKTAQTTSRNRKKNGEEDNSFFERTEEVSPRRLKIDPNKVDRTPSKTIAAKNNQAEKPQPNIVLPQRRPPDDRPVLNDQRLENLGIRKYESKRLKLYTDLDAKIAKSLPTMIDHAYSAWVEYFGELPPNRENTEFQITGYLMKNRELFRNAKLIPPDLKSFRSGRHKGLQFWMYDQTYNYYREHLLIHEATHCFMYQMRAVDFPSWYMEGMAEFFGVHSVDAHGNYRFGVMPDNEEDFQGFGRIQIVRKDCKKSRWVALPNVRNLNQPDYTSTSGYAWSWAMCQFLDTNPKYRNDFRALRKIHSVAEFNRQYHRRFLERQKNLGTEWLLYALELQEGFDIASSAIEFRQGVPLEEGKTTSAIEVKANKGWQSSGIEVKEGKTYEIVATGSFSLGKKPKPWISEPQGVSILYFEKKPLGRLLVTIHTRTASVDIAKGQLPEMTKTISVGRGIVLSAPATGTLYFRVNDSWDSLADNSGTVAVTVKKLRQ